MDNGLVSTEPDEQAETEPAASQSSEPAAPSSLAPRRIGLLILVAAAGFAVDLITKVVALSTLEGREPVRTLGGAVYLQIVRNAGAAFGLATGLTWLLSLIMIAVVVAIIVVSRKLRSPGWAVGLGLVLAGALGNLTDRIFRAPGPLHGHVVDFVSVFGPNGEVWPVFNAADSAICVGGALIVLLSLLGRDYDGRSTTGRREGSG